MSDSTEKQCVYCHHPNSAHIGLNGCDTRGCPCEAHPTPPSVDKPCPTCKGRKRFHPTELNRPDLTGQPSQPCPTCHGTGKAPQAPNRETPAHDELDVLEAIVKHARPEGDQEDGDFVGFYILPTGPIHRAISLLQRHGRFSTPSGGLIARYDALIEREKAQARREELENFNPFFDGDHTKCPDPRTCVGYQNAVSDYENERELRLAELTPKEEK